MAALSRLARSIENQLAKIIPRLNPAEFARASLRAVGLGYLNFALTETGLFRTIFAVPYRMASTPDPAKAGSSGLNPFELLGVALDRMVEAGVLVLCAAESAQAQVRAKADVSCKPGAEKLHYDCIFKLADSRSNAPLTGLGLTVGADMPSMAGAHNVRPVKATEDEEKGTYKARIVLEMHGDWALRLDLSGKVRDRVIKVLRFESDRVGEPPPAPGRHRH